MAWKALRWSLLLFLLLDLLGLIGTLFKSEPYKWEGWFYFAVMSLQAFPFVFLGWLIVFALWRHFVTGKRR